MVFKRRLASLERTWPRRRSFADFVREVQSLAQLTGITYDMAFQRLLPEVTDEELDQMIAELEVTVGKDQTAVMRAEAEAALGGHQVGVNPPNQGSEES